MPTVINFAGGVLTMWDSEYKYKSVKNKKGLNESKIGQL